METNQVTHRPGGKTVGSVVLGIIVGALLPIVALFQISMLVPTLMLGGIFAAFLYARSGWAGPGALLAAALASSAFLLDGTLTLILLAAALLPALAIIRGIGQKAPFFEQLLNGIVAFVVGLLAAMFIAYAAYGGGMVTQFIDLLRTQYAQMPDSALQPLVEWANAMLPASVGGEAITVAYFRSQLSGLLDLMQQTYARMLPGALLSGALLSGVIAVLWGNWTLARRGMATNESFVGMSGWFLPSQVSVGAVALWAVGLIIMSVNPESGETVYLTIAQTVGAAFAVQAFSALDRRMIRVGRQLGRRRLLITLLAVAALLLRGFASMLAYVGAASALFGSHGAIKRWRQRRQDDPSDQDDSDE